MNDVSFPAVVAVYGTLRRGYGNHRLLASSKYLGPAKTKGTMYSLGPFPAISLHGNTDVQLELYEVDQPTLQSLDHLEGHPRFYQRQKTNTSAGPAWIYTMDHDEQLSSHRVVVSGDWSQQ